MMYLITTILETNLLVNIQFKIINQLNNFVLFLHQQILSMDSSK